jgi:drug/metabolite transporter (DMT)-like permease
MDKMAGNSQIGGDRKTVLFLSIAILGNSFGNLLLALAMERMPSFTQVGFSTYISGLLHNPFLFPGAALTATYAFAQLSLFSWADLSFVVPCIASSYIISTLLAEFVLDEPVDITRWLGVLLICFGVFLVARTPVTTRPHGKQVHQ